MPIVIGSRSIRSLAISRTRSMLLLYLWWVPIPFHNSRNTSHYCVCRHIGEYHRISTNHRIVSHPYVPDQDRSGANQHIVPDSGDSLFSITFIGANGHILENHTILPNHGVRVDYNTQALVCNPGAFGQVDLVSDITGKQNTVYIFEYLTPPR